MLKKIVNIILICILATSCITYSSKNRGSLSDAMDKSRDDSNDRNVPSDNDTFIGIGGDDSGAVAPTVTVDSEIGDIENLIFLIRGGSSIYSSPYFHSSSGIELLLGGSEGNFGAFLYAGVESLEVNKNHSISESIKSNPNILTAGVELRYYPLDEIEYFSPYILGRMGGILLNWQFENTLVASDGLISHDSLGGVEFTVGGGIDIFRWDFLRLGVLCKTQGYLYGEETLQGFYNDYFSGSGNINISMEVGYVF